jgi:hypothetical protein
MRRILYINGSPRGENASSSVQILKDIAGILRESGGGKEEASILSLPRKTDGETEDILQEMDTADIWVVSFPLYVDALPGHMTWWFRQYELYRRQNRKAKKIQLYAAVNCGFPEAVQCEGALDILEIFCRKNGMEWRFGIAVGMGESYKEMKNIPLRSFMKSKILRAYETLAADVGGISPIVPANLFVSVRLPRFLYLLLGTAEFKRQAKKHGLNNRDLYARPIITGHT